jgi:hypothetical protein
LAALHLPMSTDKPASTLKFEEVGEEIQSGEGQTKVGEREYTDLRVADMGMDANRQVRPSRPSRAYSMEGPV